MAEALEVSRTPVREAFLLLEAEGLMRLYPKRGALVVPVSPGEVRDLMDTRLLVERDAARRAARDASSRGRLATGLQDLLDRQQEALDAGDVPAFVRADRDFHHAIVAAGRERDPHPPVATPCATASAGSWRRRWPATPS